MIRTDTQCKKPQVLPFGLLVILMLGLLSSCTTTPPFKNMKMFPVNHPDCKAFVIIEQGFSYPLGFVDREDNLRIIRSTLQGMSQLNELIYSPDGEKVIIESYGEGHQMLNVYHVSGLLTRFDQEEEEEEIGYLDPYPYAFDKMRWVDNDTIAFESSSDFYEFDKDNRRGSYDRMDESDEIYREWHWDLETDTFNPSDPVERALLSIKMSLADYMAIMEILLSKDSPLSGLTPFKGEDLKFESKIDVNFPRSVVSVELTSQKDPLNDYGVSMKLQSMSLSKIKVRVDVTDYTTDKVVALKDIEWKTLVFRKKDGKWMLHEDLGGAIK